MKEGYSNWSKLDNAALAFPLVTGKNDTRVFRFYCELKENVKPELLQAALEKTMEKYPLFQMVLRKGLHAAGCIFQTKRIFFFRSAIMKKESILKFSMH